MRPPPLPWWAPWILVGALALLYLPALAGEVLDWDDNVWVEDPIVELGLLPALEAAFTEPRDRAWYPVLRLSWWLQPRVLGPGPRMAHVVNIGLFLGCVRALFPLLERCGLSGRATLIAVALWATHPTRVESVAWLTSRKDVLSLALVLGAAHALVPPEGQAPRRWQAAGLFALASLTKVAVAPLAGALWLVMRARDGTAAAWRHATPAVAVGLVVAVIGITVFHTGEGPVDRPYDGVPSNAVFALWQLGAWALRLVTLTGLQAVVPLPERLWPLALVGGTVLGGAAVAAVRGGPWVHVLVGLVLLPLVPVSGLVPMAFWAADRHLLVPGLAVAIAIALTADRVAPGPARWAPLALAVPLAVATSWRIPAWRSSVDLWTTDAATGGAHWARSLNLGTALGRVGRYDEAVAAFRDAERLRPGDGTILARRLIAELAADGEWTPADARAARLLQPPPDSRARWREAAAALVDARAFAQARDAARHAQGAGDDDVAIHLVLATCAIALGDDPGPHLDAAASRSGVDRAVLEARARALVEGDR